MKAVSARPGVELPTAHCVLPTRPYGSAKVHRGGGGASPRPRPSIVVPCFRIPRRWALRVWPQSALPNSLGSGPNSRSAGSLLFGSLGDCLPVPLPRPAISAISGGALRPESAIVGPVFSDLQLTIPVLTIWTNRASRGRHSRGHGAHHLLVAVRSWHRLALVTGVGADPAGITDRQSTPGG